MSKAIFLFSVLIVCLAVSAGCIGPGAPESVSFRSLGPIDADNDGYYASGKNADCDDSDPNINPGVIENTRTLCTDGIDNDCDKKIDDRDKDCKEVLAEETETTELPSQQECSDGKCEGSEDWQNCPADCPNCDDKNNCTVDEYDHHEQKCVNTPILDVICCGNGACEIGETYSNCARDCPNCDDDNECTEDSYDYHEQKFVNEPIIPCCGNGIVEWGEECDDGDGCSSTCTLEGSSQVVINEVAWMGTTTYFGDEWIELYNAGDLAQDLTGWSLVATDGTPSITLSGTIPAGGYLLLERTDDDSVPGTTADIIYTGALSNTFEKLRLKDSSGAVVDETPDGTSWAAGDNPTKATMYRIDSDTGTWGTSTASYSVGKGTPRAANY
jgi:cysteine-rich repeat protein